MNAHTLLSADPRFARAIVCGSPERAKWISEFLEGSAPVARNREYHSYCGRFDGADVLALSHGVGAAGAAIAFHELLGAGARAIVRVRTAGGLQDDSAIGDIVVPWAAIRQDGVTPKMVPEGFPAVAAPELAASLAAELAKKNALCRTGLVATSDLFYPGPLGHDLAPLRDCGALAAEMECSALFVAASLKRAKAAAVLVLDGNPLKWSEGQYDPDPQRLRASMEQAIRAALAALARSEA